MLETTFKGEGLPFAIVNTAQLLEVIDKVDNPAIADDKGVDQEMNNDGADREMDNDDLLEAEETDDAQDQKNKLIKLTHAFSAKDDSNYLCGIYEKPEISNPACTWQCSFVWRL